MSLQVWLPLNENLHNQGLSNLTFTTISANTAIDNNGKIGKCYANNSASAGGLISNQIIDLGQQQSMFCWFKFTNLTSNSSLGAGLVSQHRYSSNQGMGITIRYVSSTTGYLSVNTGTGSSRTYNTYYGTTLLQANTWYHGGYTYDGTSIRIYVNGKLEKTQAYANMAVPADYLTVFCWSTSGTSGNTTHGNYKLNGAINDVRIYDHCLSDKEVEEIAKGLILHYKLDNNGEGSRNLLLGTYNFDNWYLQSRWTKDNNIATYTEGSKTWHDMDSPTIPWTDVQGKTLTISADIRSDDFNYTDGSGFSICFVRKASGPNATGYSTRRLECTPIHLTVNQITSEWKRYSATVTNISDSSFNLTFNGGGGDWFGIYIWNYTNKSMQIKNIKLEIGNKATHYSQAPEDFGLDGNIIYDSSGYEHYGELYNYDTNGSITIVSDSPRYNVSTFINSTNNTTNTASGTRYIYGHCALTNPTTMSVAFWCKPVAGYGGGTGQGQFCTTTYEFGSTSVGSDYQASAMNHRDSAVDINDSASTTQCRPAFSPTANEWHHYVITYDGQNGKVYKDGVQSSTASFSAAKTLDSFIGVIIGFSKAGGVWRSNQSYFSDFRVYVTALTADQIIELYHTSASIDNKGNSYARELVEN